MCEDALVTTPVRPRHAPQAQTLQGGGGRRSLRGQDLPHPQVRSRPPPLSTAVGPAWEAQSQVTVETTWPLGGDAGNWGDGRRAESAASREPGDGQAALGAPCSTAPCPPCWPHGASPHPDPNCGLHLWQPLPMELLLAAPSACGLSPWPVSVAIATWSPRAGGRLHTWPLTASWVPQVLQECLQP